MLWMETVKSETGRSSSGLEKRPWCRP